jgi:hypothetical protein
MAVTDEGEVGSQHVVELRGFENAPCRPRRQVVFLQATS